MINFCIMKKFGLIVFMLSLHMAIFAQSQSDYNYVLKTASMNAENGMSLSENFKQIETAENIQASLRGQELDYWIKKSKNTSSFSELMAHASSLNMITQNQVDFLKSYDEVIFAKDLTPKQALSNLSELTNQIENNSRLTKTEKDELLALNKSIKAGIDFATQNRAAARNGWRCAAGIAVTAAAGFAFFNPLGVIAGAGLISAYC